MVFSQSETRRQTVLNSGSTQCYDFENYTVISETRILSSSYFTCTDGFEDFEAYFPGVIR